MKVRLANSWFYYKVVIGLFLGGLITACGSNPEIQLRNSNHEGLEILKPQSAKVYLETSLSMKGYVSLNKVGDYKFKDVVNYLITDLDESVDETVIYTITDEPRKYTRSREVFYQSLKTGSLLEGKSSKLNEVFSKIIENTKPNEVSFLISDCVMDLGERTNLTEGSTMKGEIYQALTKNKELAALCYMYTSDFNGDYYYNQLNDKPFLGMVMNHRPFYIWVLGSPSNLSFLTQQVSQGGKRLFDGYDQVYSFGIEGISVTSHFLSYPKKGKVSLADSGKLVRIRETPSSFSLGFNASSSIIPLLGKDLNASLFTVEPDYLGISTEINYDDSLKNDRYYSYIAQTVSDYKLDVILTFNFEKEIRKLEKDITVKISKPSLNWVRTVSLDNDEGLTYEELEGKTFSFNYITEAFDRRYGEETLVNIVLEVENK